MDIVVLCGGLCAERDVSLSTGAMAAAALKRLGHRVVTLDLFLGRAGAISSFEELFASAASLNSESEADAVIAEAVPDLAALKASRAAGGTNHAGDSRVGENVFEICRAADIVFMALHGEDGEDGKLQAAFDLLGIKYTGTGFFGSAISMDKSASKRVFRESGIKTPRGSVVSRGEDGEDALLGVGLPCVVKPCAAGSSVGVSLVHKKSEYPAALELALRFSEQAIVEEHIRGREIDVGVLAGKALPPIEIRPDGGFYDYKNKYQKGVAEELCPAPLPQELTERLLRTAEAVFYALGMQVYARMDFIADDDGEIWCLEGNTLPGLTPTSLLPQEAAAAGISYDALIDAILRESLKKYQSV